LACQLEDLEDFKEVFNNRKTNYTKVSRLTIGGLSGGIIMAPLAIVAAPSIAAGLGGLGILGAASTGTAISSLSGAALTSASLAYIGFGTMAAGTAVITAAGAALGAANGGVVSSQYFGAIKDFTIQKVNEGGDESHAVIFINGFLSQKKQDSSDWRKSVRSRFYDRPWYYTTWESKSNASLGGFVGKASAEAILGRLVKRVAKRGIKKAINPLAWPLLISDLASNPWHTSYVKSMMTGVLLADLIARCPNQKFTIMAHSLGTRVAQHTLLALSTRGESVEPKIKDVYLLGGATDRTYDAKSEKDGVEHGWKAATRAVSGTIHNCYSKHDDILRYIYQAAQVGMSKPIGRGPIEFESPKIKNWDVSSIVEGHMKYKENFDQILNMIHGDQ
jgi:hypothetical protein